jgi:hypothetical protein
VVPTDIVVVAMDEVVPRDRSLAPVVAMKVNSSAERVIAASSARVVAAEGPTSSSGPTVGAPYSPLQAMVHDNTIEETVMEPEVILRYRPIRALGDVSLSDAMGMTHFVLK